MKTNSCVLGILNVVCGLIIGFPFGVCMSRLITNGPLFYSIVLGGIAMAYGIILKILLLYLSGKTP